MLELKKLFFNLSSNQVSWFLEAGFGMRTKRGNCKSHKVFSPNKISLFYRVLLMRNYEERSNKVKKIKIEK